MKNITAAIGGALATAAIGGLAYVGKRIYDTHYHYRDCMIDDDEYESDSYVDEDDEDETSDEDKKEDDDFFEEDEKEKTTSNEKDERADINVSECVEYDRDAFLPEYEETEKAEETTEENQ